MTQTVIAKIVNVHGIKGFVKLRLDFDDVSLFDTPVLLPDFNSEEIRVTLKNKVKNMYLAEVEGLTDRTTAEGLKGSLIYSTIEVESEDHALLNMRCADKDGNNQGTVIDVVNYGASDLLEIKPNQGESFFIPLSDDFVTNIDTANNHIIYVMPEVI